MDRLELIPAVLHPHIPCEFAQLLLVALVGAGAWTLRLHQRQAALEASFVGFDHVGDDQGH